ncbi:hypothetical protein EVAR_33234_1 [Eumeta japonica]|uniref:Uncharacterized protein n=1 Tax=Eumeta variegata TaxID=151549 RepID=A0A4C1W3Q5_EUMVA|nr:hypothetical protein EVAR_33234_1 [Eumeta japonica]
MALLGLDRRRGRGRRRRRRRASRHRAARVTAAASPPAAVARAPAPPAASGRCAPTPSSLSDCSALDSEVWCEPCAKRFVGGRLVRDERRCRRRDDFADAATATRKARPTGLHELIRTRARFRSGNVRERRESHAAVTYPREVNRGGSQRRPSAAAPPTRPALRRTQNGWCSVTRVGAITAVSHAHRSMPHSRRIRRASTTHCIPTEGRRLSAVASVRGAPRSGLNSLC